MRDGSRYLAALVRIVAVSLIVCMTGCRQKELGSLPEDAESIVDIEFIWDHAENAKVEGMSVFFYPMSAEGKIWNFEISGMEGGPVSLFPGSYTLLAINNDLPGIDLTTGQAPASIVANAIYYDDGTLRPSGMIYGAMIENVNIPTEVCKTEGAFPARISCIPGSIRTVTVSPDSLATVYNIVLKDVNRPENIESLTARISGVAVSLTVDGSLRSEKTGTINIPIDIAGTTMAGSTTGLGIPSGTPHFTLTLFAQLTDRRQTHKSLTFDITEQVVRAKHPHNVFLTLSGIDFDGGIPDEGKDVGMDVDVENWNSITIDLITGI